MCFWKKIQFFYLIFHNIMIIFYFSGLGSKKAPLHFLLQHGELPLLNSLNDFETYSHQELIDWFSSPSGQSEGIVWHSKTSNDMFKV